MMKKYTFLLSAVLISLCLSGCGSAGTTDQSTADISTTVAEESEAETTETDEAEENDEVKSEESGTEKEQDKSKDKSKEKSGKKKTTEDSSGESEDGNDAEEAGSADEGTAQDNQTDTDTDAPEENQNGNSEQNASNQQEEDVDAPDDEDADVPVVTDQFEIVEDTRAEENFYGFHPVSQAKRENGSNISVADLQGNWKNGDDTIRFTNCDRLSGSFEAVWEGDTVVGTVKLEYYQNSDGSRDLTYNLYSDNGEYLISFLISEETPINDLYESFGDVHYERVR